MCLTADHTPHLLPILRKRGALFHCLLYAIISSLRTETTLLFSIQDGFPLCRAQHGRADELASALRCTVMCCDNKKHPVLFSAMHFIRKCVVFAVGSVVMHMLLVWV
jgi:hypothetical protein